METVRTRVDPNEIFLQLIHDNSFNSMRGEVVASDLRENRALWDGVLFCRPDGDWGITLRDMPTGSYNADTIFLLTTKERAKQLFEVASKWSADCICVTDATGEWSANRWDSEDCESYELKLTETSGDNCPVSRMLGSHSTGENRVALRLWWD